MTSVMNTFTKMEDIQLLSEDWQLEPSLGLTLFDDLWKAVDLESTGLKDVVDSTSNNDCFKQLFDLPQTGIADSICEDWMENADITDMLHSLVQDSEALKEVNVIELTPPSTPPNTELKGSDILRTMIEQGLKEELAMSPKVQVAPSFSLKPDDSENVLYTAASTIAFNDVDGIVQSPLSADYVDDLISETKPSSKSTSSSCSELQAMLLEDIPVKSRTRSTPCSEMGQRSNVKGSCNELEAMLLEDLPVSNSKTRSRYSPYESGQKSKCRSTKIKNLQVEYLSKKDKKKLQNKNAAIRYRHKKKQEAEVVKDEESILESKNKELSDKVDQIRREIQYMKDLMAEVYKAKVTK